MASEGFKHRLAPVELRLETFQGPLDLLLTLIDRRRLPITSVSLAAVADQYLSYVRSLPSLDPDLLADFLLVAARLLLIKSRAILPGEEPEADEEDPADELAARLQEYRLFRAAAEYLQGLERQDVRAYPRPPRLQPEQGAAPLAPIQPDELVEALRRLLERQVRKEVPTAEVQRVARATVEARAELILRRLTEAPSVLWDAVCGERVDEVVATFLAVLEMLKQGQIGVDQEELFGRIVIRRAS